jgi:D-inositol-3-phosphate glycosyltransferase
MDANKPVARTSIELAGSPRDASSQMSPASLALLTGGGDRPYVFGLATALSAQGVRLHLIGSDDLVRPEFYSTPGVTFLNLRGDQDSDVSFFRKAHRLTRYYIRLLRYAWNARPIVFHILWNNKIEFFDRTLLMLYYRWLGKRIVLTAHNVNKCRRDGNDTALNRLTLRMQYRLANHILVHTPKMKQELVDDLGLADKRITVIPFGINNSVPNTALTPREARLRLGIGLTDKTILFFGRITPYKGLDYLVAAFRRITKQCCSYRLIIAGRPDHCDEYWRSIEAALLPEIQSGRVLLHARHIPDDDTELYFKAADVFVLPYRDIYQSGVMFLGQSFGLPVIAADVGSFGAEVIEGTTGFLFARENPVHLATVIERYFDSDLYMHLDDRRPAIREHTEKHHSWVDVAQITTRVYDSLLQSDSSKASGS